VKPVVTFAYITGWRTQSEILSLQWRQVDFRAETVTLDPGTTKNKEGRVFPFSHELRQLLGAQRVEADRLQRERGIVCPWVFHNDGVPPWSNINRPD
jgi:integrase